MKKELFLSKSKYLQGLKCPKLLWVSYNSKEEIPEVDEFTQALFDQGNLVTQVAHQLFPGGVEIPGVKDYDAIIKETQNVLSTGKTLFEPGFRYKNAFSRPDVLKPNKDGSWDIFEVKSSAEVKDVYYPDIAFQKYCYEGAGLKIRRAHIIHINSDYVRRGEIDPEALFTIVDVTGEISGMSAEIQKNIDWMLEIIDKKSRPETKIGIQCLKPYKCGLKDACWEFLPADSVFLFNKINKKKAFGYISQGVLKAIDIPEKLLTATSHKVQRACHQSGKTHADLAVIQGFIKQLKFPLHFIDFETVGAAIPLFNGSRPFQQIPFQFSVHVWESWDKKPKHYAFLAEGKNDPRPEFLKRLKPLIGGEGSVLVYNVDFEERCLAQSVEEHPEYQDWFKGVQERFVDLMVPFRRFDYYDPKQMGRYSIKFVYPALVGGSYKGMEISDGGQASREYGRVTYKDGIAESERRRIYDGLLEYCKLDTQAMIEVLEVLRKSVLEQKIKRGEV